MKTIGELVEETIYLAERSLYEQAFVTACDALQRTAQIVYQDETLPEPVFQRFIRDNWRLISFMGTPEIDEIPPDFPFRLRRALPSFNVADISQEIVIFSVRQTLATKRIPLEIGFHKSGKMAVATDKLLFPQNVVFGLLGSVVFHSANKNEKVSDKHWMNIGSFQMFISELWGRQDLAQRILDFYTEQKKQNLPNMKMS